MKKLAFASLTLASCMFVSCFSKASQLPSTDIYLADIQNNAVLSVINISNRDGYDNQPNFGDDGVLFTAGVKINGKWQTDIMYYNFQSKATINITNSIESEYSPTIMPSGEHISVIRATEDGKQELWRYGFNHKSSPALIYKEPNKLIGYHAWGTNNDLVTFVLGEPHSLYIGNTDQQVSKQVVNNIGRTLAFNQKLGQYSFSHYREKGQYVALFDATTERVTSLFSLPTGVDYYAWQGSEHIIFADKAVIYRWQLGKKIKPKKWLDLSVYCSTKITRLKYHDSLNKLAFVCER